MPQQIDQINKLNTNNDLLVTKQELDTFFSKNKESDVKELVTELNDAVEKNKLGLDVSIDNAFNDIAEKITKYEMLTSNEIKLLKMCLVIKYHANINNFDDTWPTELPIELSVFRRAYGEFYTMKNSLPKNEVSLVVSNQPKNDIDIIKHREGYGNVTMDQMLNRAKKNYASEYDKFSRDLLMKYDGKPHEQDYIKYESVVFAFEKYASKINEKERGIKQTAGYATEKEYNDQIYKMEQLQKYMDQELAKAFPEIKTTQAHWKNYQDKIQVVAKRIGYDKGNIYQEHSKIYDQYIRKMNTFQSNEIDQKELENAYKIVQNPNISTQEEMESYMKAFNYVQYFSQKSQEIKSVFGPKLIDGFEIYNKEIAKINKEVGAENIKKRGEEINNYYKKMQDITKIYGAGIDFQKYQKYVSLMQKSNLLPALQSIQYIGKMISNPAAKDSLFFGLKEESEEKMQHQEKINAIYDTLRVISPELYTIVNFATGAWNGLVDALVGTGSSLGIMLMSLYKNDAELEETRNYKLVFDDFLKIGVSSSMKEPAVKDGKWNLGFDNTVNQVGSQISNMLVLLSGGSAIGKGVAKLGQVAEIGTKFTVQYAPKIGLFTNAMIMQSGRSFEEGLSQGLTRQEAFGYGMLQSVVSSSLELIAPNNLIKGEWNQILTKLAGQEGPKKILTQMMKNLGKEMGEEIIQEETQFIAQKGIDVLLNTTNNFHLDASMSWADFTTTAVLTGLTTGIASGKQSHIQAQIDIENTNITENRNKAISYIAADPSRYVNYMSKLDGMINSSSGEVLQQYQILRREIQSNYEKINIDKIVSDETLTDIEKNAKLSDTDRLSKAAELLGVQLSPEQQKSILAAHNLPGEIFTINFEELRARVEILKAANLTSEQIRILLENGICGKEENINNLLYNRRNSIENSENVDRKSETFIIGDLAGKLKDFDVNMKVSGYLDVEGNWTGEKKRLIFLGDIVGDSGDEGFLILDKIAKINEQAKKQGGEVIYIAGNHDVCAVDVLTMSDENILNLFGRDDDGNYSFKTGKQQGFNELQEGFGDLLGAAKTIEDINNIREIRRNILETIKNDPLWQKRFEVLCNSRIFEQIDDVFYLHKTPSDEVLNFIKENSSSDNQGNLLLGSGIDKINAIWQKGLRNQLMNDSELTSEESILFERIKKYMLEDGGYDYSNISEETQKNIRKNGINTIHHGHATITAKNEKMGDSEYVSILCNDARKGSDRNHRIPKGKSYVLKDVPVEKKQYRKQKKIEK